MENVVHESVLQSPHGSTKFSSIKKTCRPERKVCDNFSELEKEIINNFLKEK